MMYKFYLDGVMLPIAPSSLKTTIKNKDETVDLINGGTLSILNSPGLTTFEFDFILPASPIGSNYTGFREPDYYTRKLELLKNSKQPFQFVITRTANTDMPVVRNLQDTNILVSLDEYDITEDAESYGFHKLVSVRLQEYQNHKTKSDVEISTNGGTVSVPEPERNITVYHYTNETVSGSTHKVQEGDTLQSISQQWYGTMDYWEAIAECNGLDPSVELKVGMYLAMNKPDIETKAEELDKEHEAEQKKNYTDIKSSEPTVDPESFGSKALHNLIDGVVSIPDKVSNAWNETCKTGGEIVSGFNNTMDKVTGGWWPW